MARVFISYRRIDGAHQAGRLYAELKRSMVDAERNVFIDINGIPLGVDYVEYLETKVSQCDVLLALIGSSWLHASDPETGARRLDDHGDFVRIEIAAALRRGIVVVPVLLDGAAVPREGDLPDDIKLLARRQGTDVRHISFEADVLRLAKGLGLSEQPGVGANSMSVAVSTAPTSEDEKNPANKNDQFDPFDGMSLKKFTDMFKEFAIDPNIVLGPKLANASDAEKIARLREAANAYNDEVVKLQSMTLPKLKNVAAEMGVAVDVGRVRLTEKQIDIYVTQIAVTNILRTYALKNGR